MFVDSAVQGALLRQCALHWIVFVVVTATLLLPLQYLVHGWESLFSNQVDTSPNQSESLWVQYKPLVIILIVMLPAFLYDLVKLSHRFAGPIMRLRGEIERAARGKKFQKIHFRKNDLWQEMADEFNAMIERFEEQIEGLKSDRNEESNAEMVSSPSCELEDYDELNTPVTINT